MSPVDTDNLFGDFIANVGIVLDENRRTIGLKKVYHEDVNVIDVTPSIAIATTAVSLEPLTLGSRQVRFEVDIVGELWYYHEEINIDTRRNEVMKSAWEVCKVLQTNATLNGWLKSTRAYIRACTWAVRRHSSELFASARIILVARTQQRFDIS